MTAGFRGMKGECADLLRARSGPALAALGQPGAWTGPLRWVTDLMLGASEPMFCCLGAERRILYNDAYVAILGDRHPSAMGLPIREVWHDIWESGLEALVERAFAGESIVMDDSAWQLQRDGQVSEAHFAFGYHPLRDNDESVVGFLCICRETTLTVCMRRQREMELARQWRAFDQAPALIAVLGGPDHRCEFANRTFQAASSGRPLVGRTVDEIFPGAVESGLGALLDEVRATGRRRVTPRIRFATQGSPVDEEARIVDFCYEPLLDDKGAVDGIFMLGNDVTELVRSQVGERSGNQRYAALLDSMDEGVIILDGDFRVITINRQGEAMDGRPASDLLGRSHWDLWPDAVGTAIEKAYREVMAGGPTQRLEHHYLSTRVDVWLDITAFSVPDGIAVIYRDVGAMKRAEEALRASEERFRAAVAAVGVMWTNNIYGRMEGAQPGWSSLTGQTEAEYSGYGWVDALHPEDAATTLVAWERAVAECRPFAFEHRVRMANGQWGRFAVRAVPALTLDGGIREWVGVHIDVTEARSVAQALEEADRRKDRFLATLSHELRNPLAAIRSAAQLVERGARTVPPPAPRELEAAAGIVGRQSLHMARLLDELLDMARITSGRIELSPTTVSLADLLEQAEESVRAAIDARGHSLHLQVSIGDARRMLMLDVVRTVQVIGNLLANALRYTPDGGRIDLHAWIAEDGLHIKVTDDGIGIEPEALPRLFDFQRPPPPPNQVAVQGEPGLGVGLALARELVELHGGSIEAQSAGPGQGTTISLCIPNAVVVPTSQSPEPVVAELMHAVSVRSVLIVDDNADAAHSLAQLLQLDGHRVDTAADAVDALAKLKARTIQVGIFDIGLPGIDGHELARRVRATPAGNRMLLVAATGWGQQEDRDRALAAGFDLHFTKPVDVEVLAEVISKWTPQAST